MKEHGERKEVSGRGKMTTEKKKKTIGEHLGITVSQG